MAPKLVPTPRPILALVEMPLLAAAVVEVGVGVGVGVVDVDESIGIDVDADIDVDVDVGAGVPDVVDVAAAAWDRNASFETAIVTPVPAQLFCMVSYTAFRSPGLFFTTHDAVL